MPVGGYPIGAVPLWSELHAYSQFGHLSDEEGGDDDGRPGFGPLARGGL